MLSEVYSRCLALFLAGAIPELLNGEIALIIGAFILLIPAFILISSRKFGVRLSKVEPIYKKRKV